MASRSCHLNLMLRLTLLLFSATTTAFNNNGASIVNGTITTIDGLLSTHHLGRKGVCVVGCTPYVDLFDKNAGIRKYRALVADMGRSCDVLVHVGDTKPGNMPCDRPLLSRAVHILKKSAHKHHKLALFAPGDNEINDCHRHQSSNTTTVPSQIVKAVDARMALLEDLHLLNTTSDLTHRYHVQSHVKDEPLPGGQPGQNYGCHFDKYVDLDHYALATLEVIGSNWYLDDERNEGYPFQDTVDPLADRLSLFVNARNCALEWIDESAHKANATGKRALFFLFHATFYREFGSQPMSNGGIGDYYNRDNLTAMTLDLLGEAIEKPYDALFDKLTEIAFAYPHIMFYGIHADAHRYQTLRLNPFTHNNDRKIFSHHNLMIHQVEGASRSLTTFARFTVDPRAFQPVTLKEEWSLRAYNRPPWGHSWKPYAYG